MREEILFTSRHEVMSIDDVLESLPSGSVLRKFVAVDCGSENEDMTVEIHGFISERGELIIISTKVKDKIK